MPPYLHAFHTSMPTCLDVGIQACTPPRLPYLHAWCTMPVYIARRAHYL